MERPLITHQEVRKNFIKSYILVILLAAMIVGLGYVIGYWINDIRYGLLISGLAVIVMVPVQLLTARFAILQMTKGKPLDLADPKHRRLKSIVEGLSISAGLRRTPDIYIVPSSVPNAFASGMSEQSAFIGVTKGLLDMMDDQELTGVVAHEISHIVHRDILLSQITVAFVSVILFLAYILSRMAFHVQPRNGNRSLGMVVLVMILFAILIRPLAQLISNLLMLAVSRKREYAADAYGVRLCGYNEGLASALEKLGGIKQLTNDQVKSLGGDAMKCMYIHFNDVKSLFSTHPPIEERIRRLRIMY
jgi:heat shock protein HtpX